MQEELSLNWTVYWARKKKRQPDFQRTKKPFKYLIPKGTLYPFQVILDSTDIPRTIRA
jgi:hypothetical protein